MADQANQPASLWQKDRQLAQRLDLGDGAAFDEFIYDHVPRLHRYALSRLPGDTSAAQDAVQTAVCKALDKLDQYRAEASLFTWLCSICRNEIASLHRQRARAIEVPWNDVQEPPPNQARPVGSPSSVLARKEAAGLVHLALDRLPVKQAQALEWKYVDGLSVQDIADRLGTTTKAAESVLSRARAGFRDAHAGVAKGLDGRGFRGLRKPRGP